jgi:hypothetical protein
MITFTVIKLSILCLYLRILGVTHKKTRKGVWAIIVFVMGIAIAGIAVLFSFCSPASKLLYPSVPGTCDIRRIQFFIQALLQVLSDFLVLIPPIPLVLGLHLSRPKKIGFVAILCIGLLSVASTPELSLNHQLTLRTASRASVSLVWSSLRQEGQTMSTLQSRDNILPHTGRK